MVKLDQARWLWRKCRTSESSPVGVSARYLWHRVGGRNILANDRVMIKGEANIETGGLVEVGLLHTGFTHRHDHTYLNVRGRLIFRGNYMIGKGCRFDIGPKATAVFGTGYVNANTTFIIQHELTVGDDCSISWGCQFLDDDFHQVSYAEKRQKEPRIVIGDHVLIGSNVTLLKGTRIADRCVVAAGAVVASTFSTPGCLIAGNPARVIREQVTWT